jgi:hypothetical protein
VSDRIRVPADVELEDRVAFGLTARQLSILAVAAVIAYLVYAAASLLVALPFAAAAATPPALAGVALAFGRKDGLSGDRLAVAAARFVASPRRHVLAPEGLPARLPGTPRPPKVAGLDLPIRAVRRSGLVELEHGRFCVLLQASGTSFALRSPAEQGALVEAFGRFLNSLTDSVQISICAEPVDLTPCVAALERAAPHLPHPALQHAAQAHAGFLTELARGEDVRRREILLVLTSRGADQVAALATLSRRAREATDLLSAADVHLRMLAGDRVAALLAGALEPPGPPEGSWQEGVVGAC